MFNDRFERPSPMFRMMAVTLDHALNEGKDERPSKADATLAAKIMLLPVTAPIKMAGGELISNGAEGLLAYGLQKIRKGFVELGMIAVIMQSPFLIFLLWKYGVYTSMWDGFLSLIAKFF